MTHYYNEFDPCAAEWLRNLIAAGHLPAGDVDTRSIVDVKPDDLVGYTQCHFFAGIGGWALAARLAGWFDDRELWTGSCPCQPFSVAGKQRGTDDERHLWPHMLRLIRARRPAVWMGEQVAAAVGKDWLDGVLADLEGIGYACGAAVVPACAVDAPHRRDRLWVVAHAASAGRGQAGLPASGHLPANDNRPGNRPGDAGTARNRACAAGDVADADQPCAGEGRQQRSGQFGGAGVDPQARDSGDVADAGGERRQQVAGSPHGDEGADEGRASQHDYVAAGDGESSGSDMAYADQRGFEAGNGNVPSAGHGHSPASARRTNAWDACDWLVGHDGKARRVEPSIRLLAHGVPARVGRLRAYGNAIVPQVAAEVIGAFMECME